MADSPSRPLMANGNNQPPAQQGAVPLPADVVNFLTTHVNLKEQNDYLAAELARAETAVAQRDCKIELLTDELRRVRADAEAELRHARNTSDAFQAGFHEMKAQLSVLAATAIAAQKMVADTANRAVESANAQMRAAGIEPSVSVRDEESTQSGGDVINDGLTSIVSKLGAERGETSTRRPSK